MEKINWGIIGLGEIAEKFSRGFSDANNANLLAISSKDDNKLENFRQQFDLEKKFTFKNYNDLINCSEVDIVYIALPNSLHYELILRCIENNKNILVEKPATLNFHQIKNIKKNLLNKDIFFSEAFMYRYFPQINLIIELIENQEIGNLLSMESSFGRNLIFKKRLFFFNKKRKIDKKNRLFNQELGGGCILDLGCYTSSFSVFISLLKNKSNTEFKVTNIQKEIGETKVDIDASAELLFNDGFKSKINASFKKDLGKQSTIYGDKGSIIINDTWLGSENTILVKNKKNRIINSKIDYNIYSYQIFNISKDIINGNKTPNFPGTSFDETFLNMKIIDDWLNA